MQITNEIRSHFEAFEGIVPHMYQDGEGYVTVGCGHLIDTKNITLAEPPEWIYGLGFVVMLSEELTPDQRRISWDGIREFYKNWGDYFRPWRAATRAEIKADWIAVKQAQRGNKARYYSNFARLGLFSVEVSQLFQSDIDRISTGVMEVYPGYNLFPDKAKLALLDIAYTTGKGGLKKFINLKKHIVQPNGPSWADAAQESNRPQVQPTRNKKIKTLFEESIDQRQLL